MRPTKRGHDVTLGYVTLAMRMWCRRLYKGARWYRTRDYSYTTYCDRYPTPHYGLVERMRDCGLIVFEPGDATRGYVWEARLTDLGRHIGSMRPNAQMRRIAEKFGEEA